MLTAVILSSLNLEPSRAQPLDVAQLPNPIPPSPQPQLPQNILPPSEDLLQTPPVTAPTPPNPQIIPSDISGTITVERFEVDGSTVFSREELAKVTNPFTNHAITFAEVLAAADAITKLYADAGYITSGASIPANQTLLTSGGVVKIQVIEGKLEDIQVIGTERLNPNYVRSRLAIATSKPLNQKKLFEALQLLQQDPLIKQISAELTAGSSPDTSLLEVKVTEAKSSSVQINLDNNRVPSIGSFQRQIQLNDGNWLGQGDNLSVAYANTDGSDGMDVRYTFPINPRNGTIQFSYNNTTTRVIEPPFDVLNIEGNAQDYQLTLRQPLFRTPTQELALGLIANRRESDIGYLQALTGERLGFPSPGADTSGRTSLSVLRFFQDWTVRSSRQVIAAYSQFSLGIGAFDATVHSSEPDSRFFAWRGQAQWVRLLAPDTLFLIRADAQLASTALVPLEQIGLGGQETVRGYRQDVLLTDNGVIAKLELRYPIVRLPEQQSLLQITPFFDFGAAWNNSGNAAVNNNTLAAIGLGLLWQTNNRLTARFDWGIPLISVPSSERTLQEQGLYFSIRFTQPF